MSNANADGKTAHPALPVLALGTLPGLTESLFAFLSRNAVNASEAFALPPEQVVEIGSRIDL